MSGENQNIDHLFSKKLKQYSSKPPMDAWDKIEQKLAEKPQRKPIVMFYRVAAAVAILLATGSIAFYLTTNAPETSIIQTAEENNLTTPAEKTEKDLFTKNSEVKNTSEETSGEPTPPLPGKNRNSNSIQSVSNTVPPSKDTEPVILAKADVTIKEYTETQNNITSDTDEANTMNAISGAKWSGLNSSTKEEIIIKETDNQTSESYLALLSEFENPEISSTDFNKWMVGGQAGPQYSYRQVTSNNATPEYIDMLNESETGVVAYAGGVNVGYKPAKRLTIQSGVYYSKIGQSAAASYRQPVSIGSDENNFFDLPGRSVNSNITTENTPSLNVATSMGKVDGQIADGPKDEVATYNAINSQYTGITEVNQYMEFLEVPIIARYAVVDRKFDFHLLGGLSTNFLIASPVYLSDGSYFKETSGLNTVNYSSTVGLGFGYKFAGNLLISLEPQFKYYLNSVNKSSSTNYQPYSFGVFSGITYSF